MIDKRIEFIKYLENEKNYSIETVKGYNDDLDKFYMYLTERNIKEVNYSEIKDYLFHMRSIKFSNKTICRKISSLRSYFKYLMKNNYIKTNPMLLVSSPKVDYRLPNYLNYNELNSLLGINLGNEPLIEIIEKTGSGRISRIKINDNYYSGIELRNLLGLRSADFDITINNDIVTFTTRGYGHGVGMSQYGANGMANSGKNYKDILSHYYKGTTIKTV